MKEIATSMQDILIGKLKANGANPRQFDRDQDLDDLSRSISVHGIIEPLVVSEADEDGMHTIIAGHRRWMAADGVLQRVPCVVRPLEDDGLTLALVENTQRVDLSPNELAKAIGSALKRMKQKDLAHTIGRSAAYVSKFQTINKARAKIESKGDPMDADYFDSYANAEELYEHAREVLGLKKPMEQQELPVEAPETPAKAPEGQKPPLNELEALESLIRGHAELSKVKTRSLQTTKLEDGAVFVGFDFKNLRDAEKFFKTYSYGGSK